MKKLAIVGNSTLARSFIEKYKDKFSIEKFNRPEYDISNKESCITLISELNNFDIVIITSGVKSEDLWDTYITNTVGPNYVTYGLYAASKVKRIIVVSSYGGTWPSWPKIEKWRLFYNSSKQATTNFLTALYHSAKSTTKITAFDPSAFKSDMNPADGMETEQVADTLYYIATLPDSLNIPNMKINKGQ
jgi:NADP-dependent 3-hydroxy acid dehydrogenase YdfG